MPEQDVNAISALLAEFSTKVKDIEEHQVGITERLTLLNQTFLKQQRRVNEELGLIKSELSEIRAIADRLKEGLQHIIRESAGFARKEELKTLQRYLKIWEPLKFVKEEEVKEMISEALKKRE